MPASNCFRTDKQHWYILYKCACDCVYTCTCLLSLSVCMYVCVWRNLCPYVPVAPSQHNHSKSVSFLQYHRKVIIVLRKPWHKIFHVTCHYWEICGLVINKSYIGHFDQDVDNLTFAENFFLVRQNVFGENCFEVFQNHVNTPLACYYLNN